MRRLPALHLARLEKLRHAGDIALAVMELLLHLAAIGPEEARLRALGGALACELGRRRAAGLQPGVAAQPLDGVPAPRFRIALIEQHPQPLEELARQIVVGHEQAIFEGIGAPDALWRLDDGI